MKKTYERLFTEMKSGNENIIEELKKEGLLIPWFIHRTEKLNFTDENGNYITVINTKDDNCGQSSFIFGGSTTMKFDECILYKPDDYIRAKTITKQIRREGVNIQKEEFKSDSDLSDMIDVIEYEKWMDEIMNK